VPKPTIWDIIQDGKYANAAVPTSPTSIVETIGQMV
jgi:hypothetical protein